MGIKMKFCLLSAAVCVPIDSFLQNGLMPSGNPFSTHFGAGMNNMEEVGFLSEDHFEWAKNMHAYHKAKAARHEAKMKVSNLQYNPLQEVQVSSSGGCSSIGGKGNNVAVDELEDLDEYLEP